MGDWDWTAVFVYSCGKARERFARAGPVAVCSAYWREHLRLTRASFPFPPQSCTKGSGDGAANAEAEVVEEEVWVDSAEENLADIQRMGSPIPPVASSA